MTGTFLGAQTHGLEGFGSSAPSPAPDTPQCCPLASSTFLIPLHKFQLIRFQLLAMKDNKCEGWWGILGTHFCGLAAQMEAKGNYFLGLENPCLGRKQIPAPPSAAVSTALNKHPLISHPRAKSRLFVSGLSIQQLLQPNKNHLPSHTSAGICTLRVMDGPQSQQNP